MVWIGKSPDKLLQQTPSESEEFHGINQHPEIVKQLGRTYFGEKLWWNRL
jgi:hypothetical protein